MKKLTSIFKQLETVNCHGLDDIKKITACKKIRFNFKTNHFTYPCLFQNQRGDALFVLFHGAKDRHLLAPPYFERWSWANVFPGPILHFSDPSLGLDNNLRLAWFVGKPEEYPLKIIAEIVETVAASLSIDHRRIITYGSSAGGFCSLAIAQYLKDPVSIAINPQTNALLYYQNHVTDMLNICLRGISKEAAHRDYANRLDMVTNYLINRESRLLLVQNTVDHFHYKNHFAPLAAVRGIPVTGGVAGNGHSAGILYSSKTGHGPEPRQMVPKILETALALQKKYLHERQENPGKSS